SHRRTSFRSQHRRRALLQDLERSRHPVAHAGGRHAGVLGQALERRGLGHRRVLEAPSGTEAIGRSDFGLLLNRQNNGVRSVADQSKLSRRGFVKSVAATAGAAAIPAALPGYGLAQAPSSPQTTAPVAPLSLRNVSQFPGLSVRGAGWLRFLWEKATTR